MKKALLLMSIAAMAVPAAAQVPVPWSVDERLQEGDRQDGDRHFHDDHPLQLEQGQRYRLSAESEAFDTRIELLRGEEIVAENDDSGGGLNSRLTFTPDRSGTYVLRVRAFAPEGNGAYSARAETLPALPAPISSQADTRAAGWQIWQGELKDGDGDLDGALFDDYLLTLRRGEARLILLESDVFDPIISVIRPDAREGDPIDGDDDTGPGFHALLGFQAEADGDYLIRVRGFGTEARGRYRLRISDAVTPPPLAQAPEPASAD